MILTEVEADMHEKVRLQIYGGFGKTGDAVGNAVSLVNAVIPSPRAHSLYGGYAKGDASGSRVELIGSVFKGDVTGAKGQTATDVSVTIDASTVAGEIRLFEGTSGSSFSNGTLTIRGASVLDEAKVRPVSSASAVVSNTTLRIDGFTGSLSELGTGSYGGFVPFDTIIFSGGGWTPGGTLITVKSKNFYGMPIAQSSIGSIAFANADEIGPGETMTLIRYEPFHEEVPKTILYTDGEAGAVKEVVLQEGTATEIPSAVTFGETAITLTTANFKRAEQTTIVGETHAVAALFMHQTADLMESALVAAPDARGRHGLTTFAATEGSVNRYDTATDLKMNGWSVLAGVNSTRDFGAGELTTALFMEHGEANYHSTNRQGGVRFRTDGDIEYVGGGASFRWRDDADWYVEGSLRAGRMSTEIDRALLDATGAFHNAETDAAYFGAHAGAGHVFRLTDAASLDAYAKYYFTRTGSDEFKVGTERYAFEAVTSHRARIGATFGYDAAGVLWTAGAGAEYEFDGVSRMRAASTPTMETDYGGWTGFAEAGASVPLGADSPRRLNLQVRGWAGERDAFSGAVSLYRRF